jgi:hypothetical protein
VSRIYIGANNPEHWRQGLADPAKQWKKGFSARTLAYCWHEANSDFPQCVKKAFRNSGISAFENIELLFGLPEYKVPLPGGKRESQNDIYVVAKGGGDLISIMIEGKVSESFDKKVDDWLGKEPSLGKQERLGFLLDKLNLHDIEIKEVRYQLLHRTVSAILEAEKMNAKHALMLVHSFSQTHEWFDDYSYFVNLFGLSAEKDNIVGPIMINDIYLYFGWVTGDTRFLEC